MSQARDFADSFSAVSTGRRNMIINGAMQVAQRSTSAVAVSNNYPSIDRFKGWKNTGAWTVEQSTTAPDGFSTSLKAQVTTANSSLSANHYAQLSQQIESQNLQHLQYGTSGAKTLTLSFYVRSNKTGTYFATIYKSQNTDYLFTKSYTINSADTWERKTITIPADSNVPALLNNTGIGFYVFWNLALGTNFDDATDNAWSSNTSHYHDGNQVNWLDSTSNNFYLTGVQLEVGNSASPFEHRSYGEELALCQRYFQKTGNVNASNEWFPGVATNAGYGPRNAWVLKNNADRAWVQERFPVVMRSSPTLTLYPGRGDVTNSAGNITHYNAGTAVSWTNGPNGSCTGLSGYFQGISSDNGAGYTMHYTVDAEI